MNKAELVINVADKAGIGRADVGKAMDAFISVVTQELAQGGKVQLVGFGTLEAVKKAEKAGRNPKTGEKITIPERVSVKFKPGKELKDAVNG